MYVIDPSVGASLGRDEAGGRIDGVDGKEIGVVLDAVDPSRDNVRGIEPRDIHDDGFRLVGNVKRHLRRRLRGNVVDKELDRRVLIAGLGILDLDLLRVRLRPIDRHRKDVDVRLVKAQIGDRRARRVPPQRVVRPKDLLLIDPARDRIDDV